MSQRMTKYLFRYLMLWILSMPLILKGQQYVPSQTKLSDLKLYGSIIDTFNEHGAYYEGDGIYTFSPSAPGAIKLVKKGIRTYGGGTFAQGLYYSINYTEKGSKVTFPITLYVYDTKDWSLKQKYTSVSFSSIASDLTFDPETRQIFGCFSNSDYSKVQTLGRLVMSEANGTSSFRSEPIGELAERMVGLTANLSGQLYGIGASGKFYKIDKYTAECTLVGSTKVETNAMWQSATCDYDSGKIYWFSTYNEYWDTGVFEINPEDATTKLVADFGADKGTSTCEQFTGVFLWQAPDLMALPKEVTDLTVTLTSLNTADVSFVLPSKGEDGGDLPSQLQWCVRINGALMKSSTGAPGEKVSLPISVSTEGSAVIGVTTTIKATAGKPDATSRMTCDTAWFGYGIPLAPSDCMLEAQGQDITLSWKAPSGCAKGGFLDDKNLSYKIVRFIKGSEQDSVILAENLATCSISDNITSLQKHVYYYKIFAKNGQFISLPLISKEIQIGNALVLPYLNEFDRKEDIDGFVILDSNNDANTWSYSEIGQKVGYSANANVADDWLITPPVQMNKGAIYKVTFNANNTYPVERIEVALGTQPSAEGMTIRLIDPMEITVQNRNIPVSTFFRATSDGIAYIGIHAISEANRGSIYIDNLSIIEIPVTAPESVSDFKVISGEKGANEAHITFNAPTTLLSGEKIGGKLSIRINRDGKTINTITEAVPGTEYSYKDTYVPTGLHTYSVLVASADGVESIDKSQRIYVGMDVPGGVVNLRAVEDLKQSGRIHISWDAPEKGMNGGYIDPENLTYYISIGYETSDRNLGKNTYYDDQLPVKDKQLFQAYSVYAVNDAGSGRKAWQTCTAIAGPAVKAPMVESFPKATMKSGPWLTKMTNGKIGEAYCYCMSDFKGVLPQDNDGGMQSFSATSLGKSARSESPKIDIRGLQKPVLNFWVRFNGVGDSLTVSISPEYKGFVPLLRLEGKDGDTGWNRYSVELSEEYKTASFIQIGFEGKAMHTLENFADYDNVSIVEKSDYDLMAWSFSGPERITTNEYGKFDFTFRNNTSQEVYGVDYEVVLFKNGKEVNRIQGVYADADGIASVSFKEKASVLDPEVNTYTAALSFSEDQVRSNDTSNEVKATVIYPDYPTPTELKAISEKGDVRLSWTAPDLIHRANKRTLDTFEDYEAFLISNFGDWTTIDRDKQRTIRITLHPDMGPIDYPHAGEPMAFQVFNVDNAGIPYASWDPYSGNQVLASFACAAEGLIKQQNDDWLISPELDGSAQTIKFFAKAGMGAPYLPEQIELLYSLSDKDTNHFVKVGETINVENVKGWKEYTFDVPKGSKYFAIRNVSDKKFALLLDDISYIKAGAQPEELQLKGYNVYRDGQKRNTEYVTAREFRDTDVEPGKEYTYLVTAVYDKGESLPTNKAALQIPNGISNIYSGIEVIGLAGGIQIKGADGQNAKIYQSNGELIVEQRLDNVSFVFLAQGAYIIVIGDNAYKTIVK